VSLSRAFARFVADLTFDDLPAAVVDRAKGVALQALASALLGHDMPAGRQALAMMQRGRRAAAARRARCAAAAS